MQIRRISAAVVALTILITPMKSFGMQELPRWMTEQVDQVDGFNVCWTETWFRPSEKRVLRKNVERAGAPFAFPVKRDVVFKRSNLDDQFRHRSWYVNVCEEFEEQETPRDKEILCEKNQLKIGTSQICRDTGWPKSPTNISVMDAEAARLQQIERRAFRLWYFLVSGVDFIPTGVDFDPPASHLVASLLSRGWQVDEISETRATMNLMKLSSKTPDYLWRFSKTEILFSSDFRRIESIRYFDQKDRLLISCRNTEFVRLDGMEFDLPRCCKMVVMQYFDSLAGSLDCNDSESLEPVKSSLSIDVDDLSISEGAPSFQFSIQYDVPGAFKFTKNGSLPTLVEELSPNFNFVRETIERDRKVIDSMPRRTKRRVNLAGWGLVLIPLVALALFLCKRKVFVLLVVGFAFAMQPTTGVGQTPKNIVNAISDAQERIEGLEIIYRVVEDNPDPRLEDYEFHHVVEKMDGDYYSKSVGKQFGEFSWLDDPKRTAFEYFGGRCFQIEWNSRFALDVTRSTNEIPGELFDAHSYLNAIGLWVLKSDKPVRFGTRYPVFFADLRDSSGSECYVTRRATTNGREVLISEGLNYDRIVVDAQMPTMVLSRELAIEPGGREFLKFEYSDHASVRGVWMPMKVVCTIFDQKTAERKVYSKYLLKVIDIRVGQNFEGFEFKEVAGMLVHSKPSKEQPLGTLTQVTPGGLELYDDLAAWAVRCNLAARTPVTRTGLRNALFFVVAFCLIIELVRITLKLYTSPRRKRNRQVSR